MARGGRERERRPDFRCHRKIELRRHDADHQVIHVVQPYGGADDVAVAAESPLPEAMAEDHFTLAARLIFAGAERAAERRLHAEHIEEIDIDQRLIDALRLAARTRDIGETLPIAGHA